jgi:hypothetical protein
MATFKPVHPDRFDSRALAMRMALNGSEPTSNSHRYSQTDLGAGEKGSNPIVGDSDQSADALPHCFAGGSDENRS